MPFLTVTGISKLADGKFVVKDISFVQRKFQKIVIAGETGSGKSTLLKIIAGLVQQDAGVVRLENKRVEGPDEKLVPGHPNIAYLSQYFELPPFLRVEQILTYSNQLTDEAARTLYEVCDIAHLVKRNTDQLSGGERQRIALALLLTTSPKLLLLDEPFSTLDIIHREVLKGVIQNISKRLKISVILVSHDPSDVLPWADEILVMKEGQALQQGTPEKMYRQPINIYVAGLFGSYNLLTLAQSKAFTSLLRLKANRKFLFVRPGNFKLVKEGEGLKGKVKAAKFFGSYQELEVFIARKPIIIHTEDHRIKEGDTVYVTLLPTDMGYVKKSRGRTTISHG
ncbi:MAG TPA: ABC transporter ATP-binding protein [Cyclobacteriaceae bacterium]|nr:ABC transporter ATP-binding protein [Cyclobacteriaceae bacterium]